MWEKERGWKYVRKKQCAFLEKERVSFVFA